MDLLEAFEQIVKKINERMIYWEYSLDDTKEMFKELGAVNGKEIKKFLKKAQPDTTVTIEQMRELLVEDGFGCIS